MSDTICTLLVPDTLFNGTPKIITILKEARRIAASSLVILSRPTFFDSTSQAVAPLFPLPSPFLRSERHGPFTGLDYLMVNNAHVLWIARSFCNIGVGSCNFCATRLTSQGTFHWRNSTIRDKSNFHNIHGRGIKSFGKRECGR